MVFSASQWYLGSYKQKGWDRNKDTAEKSTPTDLCTAFCRSKIHIFALGTTGNRQETQRSEAYMTVVLRSSERDHSTTQELTN